MEYSIDKAKALFQRWKDSASITRIVFADIATGGSFTGLISSIVEPAEPSDIKFSVEFEVLLPNAIRGRFPTLIDVRFWGDEEIEFTDFTDEPPKLMPVPDDLERFNSSLAIKYEVGSMVSVSELWPSPALNALLGTQLDSSQVKAMLEFLNEYKNET